jgi:hypothetical protein
MPDPESTTAQILNAAADLIERGWILQPEAVDADGRKVFPTHADAIAWSVTGAITRAAPDPDSVFRAVAALSRSLRIDGIEEWQTRLGRTQAEVVAALRAAAEEAS